VDLPVRCKTLPKDEKKVLQEGICQNKGGNMPKQIKK
jgi:hypothetical protein